MSKLSLALVPLLALGAFALPGCGGKTVTRTDSTASKDLSGRWNDVDAKQVANEMISKSLSAGWIDRFIGKHNKNPNIVLGKVIARAGDSEVISTAVFMKEIRKEFVNSGKIDVLDEDKESTRAELADQAGMTAKPKDMAVEDTADFMLKGSINVQNDQEGRESVKFYVVDLEITDVQSRKIIWTERTSIRKEVDQSRWK
jgi:PBP1b-binding outer membrane lipoprotein LpoB